MDVRDLEHFLFTDLLSDEIKKLWNVSALEHSLHRTKQIITKVETLTYDARFLVFLYEEVSLAENLLCDSKHAFLVLLVVGSSHMELGRRMTYSFGAEAIPFGPMFCALQSLYALVYSDQQARTAHRVWIVG